MKHIISIAIIPFLTTACLDVDQLADKPEEDESANTTETEDTQTESETDPDTGSDGEETDPDDGSDGEKEEEAKLPKLDFPITAANRIKIDHQVREYIEQTEVMELHSISESWFALYHDEHPENEMDSTPEKVTWEQSRCTDGLMTLVLESNDFDTSTNAFQASGQSSLGVIYEACNMRLSSDNYILFDGVLSYQMTWDGYSTAEDSVDNLLMTHRFDSVSFTNVNGDETEDSFIAGWTETKLDPLKTVQTMSLIVSESSLDDQYVKLETTTDIVYNHGDGYPSTGAVSVTGGNDTHAEYTIVANGVEVSVNGAQPVLVTWSDFMADDDGTN
ncbi:hypothetical protein [Saccharospirillum salsuginis]|uniref:Lipoprotein n=1 Tax=Saccharospirillum salsuginis TaxID=418750 RepID=A0A918K7X0_9GAMM|nr:hypothetical protein [Saccharospirillum salsuginis]GGX52789.1 hypothetical protein GCM10007392_20260 [Saccharospirillum salsuginis]